MGRLLYAGAAAAVEIDDAMLAHIRMVTVTKLRRGESFALTVPAGGGASETFWINASIPIRFALDEEVPLERTLLVSLMEAANSSQGLDLTKLPSAESHIASKPVLHAVGA